MIGRSPRIQGIVISCMLENKKPAMDDMLTFNSTVKSLSPLIAKLSSQAMGLANMNRTVHQHTY